MSNSISRLLLKVAHFNCLLAIEIINHDSRFFVSYSPAIYLGLHCIRGGEKFIHNALLSDKIAQRKRSEQRRAHGSVENGLGNFNKTKIMAWKLK